MILLSLSIWINGSSENCELVAVYPETTRKGARGTGAPYLEVVFPLAGRIR